MRALAGYIRLPSSLPAHPWSIHEEGTGIWLRTVSNCIEESAPLFHALAVGLFLKQVCLCCVAMRLFLAYATRTWMFYRVRTRS